MRKPARTNALIAAPLFCFAILLSARPASAALNGNVDAAHARFITGDGTSYSDTITNVNPTSWFAVPIYHDHSYEIGVWAPNNNLLQTDPNLVASVREADGTTFVSVTSLGGSEPAIYDLGGSAQNGGDRAGLVNTGSGLTRQIRIGVTKASAGAPSATVPFFIRVIDTTQMAARWTVNGYQAFFALNNISTDTAAIGSILYYSQNGTFLAADAFNLGPNASAQIVKANGVPINGQLVGGVRLVYSGSVGQVKAQEYNYNATGGQYLTFDFGPVFQSAAAPQF